MKYTATITARQPGGEVQVPAVVYGAWAVHRKIGSRDMREWTISHVPTGRAVPHMHTELLSKAQAVEAAKRLDAEVGDRKVTKAVGKVVVGIVHRVLVGKVAA